MGAVVGEHLGMLLHLFIINRSGGLVFNRNLDAAAPNLSTNDWLRLGSTFHGLHAIAAQIAPVKSKGIEKIETSDFTLQCFQTLTGVKFIVTSTPGTNDVSSYLQNLYEIYVDFVLKNPFHENEMPIRCELFNKALDKLTAKFQMMSPAKRSR